MKMVLHGENFFQERSFRIRASGPGAGLPGGAGGKDKATRKKRRRLRHPGPAAGFIAVSAGEGLTMFLWGSQEGADCLIESGQTMDYIPVHRRNMLKRT